MTTITATYSPEDNKIRLYPSRRLDHETYEKVKAAGFKWAPKQELFVAPKWTVAREDLAIELAGEIEPEEMTLAERAALKAERLDALANKTIRKANAYQRAANELSEAFAFGQPILVGHHSERKARRAEEKMDRAQAKAVELTKSANYWLYKAEGAECHANYKNDPRVRAGRIKTLLAELRDLQRGINSAHKHLEFWATVTDDEKIAWAVGNVASEMTGTSWTAYSDLGSGKKTPQQIRADAIAWANATINGPNRRRWIDHILNRLSYERELLGPVTRYTGELTPVILQAFAREHGADKPEARKIDDALIVLESPVTLPLHLANDTILELSPDEWRDLMQSVGYEVPAKVERRKSNKPADAVLINPTPQQAAQLQRIWNRRIEIAYASKGYTPKLNSALAMTQAVYSANSGGSYSKLETKEIGEDGALITSGWKGGVWQKSGEPVARIRVRDMIDVGGSRGVIHIKDKPTKPLPIDLDAIEAALPVASEVAA